MLHYAYNVCVCADIRNPVIYTSQNMLTVDTCDMCLITFVYIKKAIKNTI